MLTMCKIRFLAIIRNKTCLFWNLAFPLILATFFGMSLPNAYEIPEFKTIPIAIVDNDAIKEDTIFQSTLKSLEEQKTPFFAITYTSIQEAQSLLDNGDVDGIIEKEDDFRLYVKEKGMNQTIIQSFMDEYKQKNSLIMNLISSGASYDQIVQSMDTTSTYITSQTNENSDVISVFFYTIIAMCCLYGSYISMNAISRVQANQTDVGARVSVSPIPKYILIAMDFVITYTIDFIILMILMLYMTFGLGVDFGNQIGYILLAIAAGVLAGNSLGILIGVAIIKKLDFKTGVLTSLTLFLCMLSGMMFIQMKYYVDTYVPFLGKINPANMITDGLYALYYYGPDQRYYMNLLSLLLFSIICYVLSFMIIRRKRYASI